MKRFILIPILVLALVVGGCQSPELVKSITKNGVQLGVAFGTEQSPEAIPYLRDYAAPVVCEAAKGTNNSPQWVIDKLKSNAAAEAELNKTPMARAIFNSAFGFYNAIYQRYGAEGVQNRSWLQAGLEGVCEGILEGLPPTSPAVRAAQQELPPHL